MTASEKGIERHRPMRLQGWWGVDYLPTGQFSGVSFMSLFSFMRTSNSIITLPLIILAAAISVNFSYAQTAASSVPASNISQPTLPAATPYTVISRDGNSAIWERTVYELDPSGQAVPRKHRYTELATGLNHMVNGQWVASSEQIDVSPDGNSAAAVNGQNQLYFPGDIYNGAIQMATPDGKTLRSQPIGLCYDDGTRSVLISVLTNATGAILPSGNQVIYQNAFTGFDTDLLYTYTKAGFEQDVVIRTEPPTPESFGLNPATTKLQVLTEFFNPPPPTTIATVLPEQAGISLTDQALDFGVMKVGLGRAFMIGDNASAGDVLVGKQWVQVGNRQILVEEVPVEAVANQLGTLPLMPGASTKTGTAVQRMASRHWQLPPPHLAQAKEAGQFKRMVAITSPRQGFVLDYQTLNSSQTNYTFLGDTTYFISGTVNFYGTNCFEGGAVIKYASGASITLQSSNLNWLAAPYHRVIFTAKDDNSVGQAISGSTGNPTNYYASVALNVLSGNQVLKNFRTSYAHTAVSVGGINLNISDGQILNCQNGLGFAGGTANLRNVLFANLQTNFVLNSGATANAQNVTFSGSSYLATFGSGSGIALTNCVLANVTNLYGGTPATFSGDFNGFYKSQEFGYDPTTNNLYPFQSAGGGNYYLTNGCAFTNSGTINIDSTLLADLATKTTHPPIVYSNKTISVATNLSPQAKRDNVGYPDLGYHYDPLDYIFAQTTVSAALTFQSGTAVGWFGGSPFGLTVKRSISFDGTFTAPDYFVNCQAVQEQPLGCSRGITYYYGTLPTVMASFTKFSEIGSIPYSSPNSIFYMVNLQMTNCEFYDGYFSILDLNTLFVNCLFDRSYVSWCRDADATPDYLMSNCTVHGGEFDISRHYDDGYPAGSMYVLNTAFDGTSIVYDDELGADEIDANAYLSGADQFPDTGDYDDVTVTNFNWQCSLLGSYYLPSDSLLINAGGATADQVGLYHFTTQTNQVPETNSVVDIGYHYVAVDQYGNPLDSNGDGIPDYLQDANGNGVYDFGDLGDWQNTLYLKVLITRPRNGSILP